MWFIAATRRKKMGRGSSGRRWLGGRDVSKSFAIDERWNFGTYIMNTQRFASNVWCLCSIVPCCFCHVYTRPMCRHMLVLMRHALAHAYGS